MDNTIDFAAMVAARAEAEAEASRNRYEFKGLVTGIEIACRGARGGKTKLEPGKPADAFGVHLICDDYADKMKKRQFAIICDCYLDAETFNALGIRKGDNVTVQCVATKPHGKAENPNAPIVSRFGRPYAKCESLRDVGGDEKPVIGFAGERGTGEAYSVIPRRDDDTVVSNGIQINLSEVLGM